MENGSMSPILLRVSVDVRDDKYLRGQTPFSSVGDGCESQSVRLSEGEHAAQATVGSLTGR
jgi:hypothetical protein